MMQTVAERYQKPLPVEIVSKLEVSRRQAERLVKREIKCPNCGFHLLEVYGTDHHITRVKCQKCKFNELIDGRADELNAQLRSRGNETLCFFFFSGDHRRCSHPWKRRVGGKVPHL